jgi:shikimate 5-dehydrogenase
VVYGLKSEGAVICIAARNLSKAKALASEFQADAVSWEQIEKQKWDLLVNTTPIGMFPNVDSSPVDAGLLTGKWVYDLVYNPRETRLLREAAQRGCGIISGAEMFLKQAAKQHQLWCGSPPPDGAMEKVLEKALVKGASPFEEKLQPGNK